MEEAGRVKTTRALHVIGALALLSGCHPSERFEAACQLVRTEVVDQDDKGKPTIFDIELEWDACPGDQFQVVRGSGAFGECMKQHEVGSLVRVEVEHFWDTRGYYTWDVSKVGNCARPIEKDSEGSYEKSQECRDVEHHGQKVGFLCSRRPFAGLVDVCPWMARN